MALDPSSSRVQAVAGFADLARLDVRGAKAAFGRALTLDSADPQAHLGLGLATIRGGQLAAGRQQIELAVALDPDNALLRTYLGLAYMQERREKVAGDELGTAERLDPNDPTPWFYDGLRKDRDNRPGLALDDVERAMALSEARGVYRSQNLLGQDEASRGAGLAQIYTDLGFEASGRNVAGLALAQDPLSGATHRFLADIYRGQPRYESARVSELLQAQLLQPLSAEPLQPSLSFANLDLARQPLFATGFNEYTSLLQGDGLRLRAEGEVGTSWTRGEEVAIGSLFDRVATSIGQAYLHSDGFRRDFNLDQHIEQAFIRVDPSELLSVQAEARRLDTHQGNRNAQPRPRRPHAGEPDRAPGPRPLGLSRRRPAQARGRGRSAGLGDPVRPRPQRRRGARPRRCCRSSAQQRGSSHQSRGGGLGPEPARLPARGRRRGRGQAMTTSTSSTSTLSGARHVRGGTSQDVAYVFADLRRPLGRTLDLELRLGFDSVDQTEIARSTPTPGAGLLWHPSPAFLARVAAGRVLKRPIVVNQTIAPAEIAGFDVVLDDPDATISDQVGLAAEYRPFPSLRLGAEIEKRWLSHQETPRARARSRTTRRSSTGWATPTGSRSPASP